jgi:TRAP-type C4-dicarboxylate transport system substrate-binding protein
MDRLGANAVVMTLGDVIPAMQQGTIDGAVGSVVVFTPMHFVDAGKYIVETGQPPVFAVNEINKKWYDALPPDLQKIVDDDAAKEDAAIQPRMAEIYNNARKGWTDAGGELIGLSADDQASLMNTLRSVDSEVSGAKPPLAEAFKVIADGGQRTR